MSTSGDASRQEAYLRTVYEPEAKEALSQHMIDIVFVHGLSPQSKADPANATWTHGNGTFWPTDLLPKRVPRARVLVFSYNSQDTNEIGIYEHANNLLGRLFKARASRHANCSYSVPIIFIAHSLGGLVVKQALINSNNNDTYRSIKESTHGLVFFAVPHQGGHEASLGAIANNSLFQEHQAESFRHQLDDYRIVLIYENRPTKFTGFFGRVTSSIIVDKRSATLGLPGSREKLLTVDSNHSDLCKLTTMTKLGLSNVILEI